MSGYEKMYVQCGLSKGNSHQVAWIPAKLATVGATVELKDDDVWENGWRVISSGVRKSESYIKERSRDHLEMRKATDI